MDQKKVLEKLLKIAENQQKIITKLAQALPPDAAPTSGTTFTPGQSAPAPRAPPAQHVKPAQPAKQDLQALVVAENPNLATVVASIAYGEPGQINVSFKAGQATQANYDAVLAAVQKLEAAQKISGGHKVHVV